MSNSEMILSYEGLAEMTQEMLAAVQQRNWEAFSELEARQAAMMIVIEQHDQVQPADPLTLSRKKALLEDILTTQRRITELLIPWRATIASLLNGVSAARRVNHAYTDAGQ